MGFFFLAVIMYLLYLVSTIKEEQKYPINPAFNILFWNTIKLAYKLIKPIQ